MKILIIEDDYDQQFILKSYIKEYNSSYVVDFYDFKEDFSDLLKSHYDLIIIDYYLKSENALKFLRTIKTLAPRTKIIACSKENDKNIILNLTKYKIDQYIIKPLPKKRLFNFLDKISI